jgi:hypothetical protein
MFESRTLGRAVLAPALLMLGYVFGIGAANAAVNPVTVDDVRAALSACGKLPLSERETCKMDVQARYGPALTPAPQPGANEATIAAMKVRYEDAMAACAKLPISERNSCTARAAAAYFGPREKLDYPASASAQRVTADETQHYRAALAACKKLPLSERTACESDAGLPSSLAEPAPAGTS